MYAVARRSARRANNTITARTSAPDAVGTQAYIGLSDYPVAIVGRGGAVDARVLVGPGSNPVDPIAGVAGAIHSGRASIVLAIDPGQSSDRRRRYAAYPDASVAGCAQAHA